jgi:thiol-disulfide isomerase/thioredoxin
MNHSSRRRALRLVAGLVMLASIAAAWAAIGAPFDAAAFDSARRSGTPLLVAIHADWCTTCRLQERVIAELLQEKRFAALKVFRVDFDAQTDAVKRFGARDRSTLIVFKNGKEVGRTLAETRREAIADLLSKAL